MKNKKKIYQNINFFSFLKTIILKTFPTHSHILLPLLLFPTSRDLDLVRKSKIFCLKNKKFMKKEKNN